MNEKELEMFKDLSFKITNETKELLLDMLYIKQMLEESELSPKDRKLLIIAIFLICIFFLSYFIVYFTTT